MLQVLFDYPINGENVQVSASCKSINGEDVEGLTFIFLDYDDNVLKITYDKEMFSDIEDQALYMLADAYYNPELNFHQH